MMYRLLIVDDEPLITNSLCDLFVSLERDDLEVVPAYSGAQALEILNRTAFDVVLSDIRMPEISGTRLLSEIKRSWPDCRVVFLTGHRDFEYTRLAIQDNAVDYLLKTEDDDRIVQAVDRAIALVGEARASRRMQETIRQRLAEARPVLARTLLADILRGSTELPIREVRTRLRELELEIEPGRFTILLLGRIDGYKGISDSASILHGVEGILRELLGGIAHVEGTEIALGRPAWLIQPTDDLQAGFSRESESRYAGFAELIHGKLDVVQEACRRHLRVGVSLALGRGTFDWTNLPRSLARLSSLFGRFVGFGPQAVVVDRVDVEPTGDEPDEHELVWIDRIHRLEGIFESGDEVIALGELDRIFSFAVEQQRMAKNVALEGYYALVQVLLSQMTRLHVSDAELGDLQMERLVRMDLHADWREIRSFFHDLAQRLFDLGRQRTTERARRIATEVGRWVIDHLHEDVSLPTLAAVVGLNPSYLSRLYHDATGRRLQDHIASVRLQRAKELLANRELKLYAVAREIGLHSTSYFIRFFRRQTGMNPKEYRERLQAAKINERQQT